MFQAATPTPNINSAMNSTPPTTYERVLTSPDETSLGSDRKVASFAITTSPYPLSSVWQVLQVRGTYRSNHYI